MNIEVCEVLANVEYVDELTKKKVVTKEFIPINTRGMDMGRILSAGIGLHIVSEWVVLHLYVCSFF